MNILSVDNLRLISPFGIRNNNQHNVSMPKFGLVMPKPLSKDTVSFGRAMAQTKKTVENLKGACSRVDAARMIEKHKNSHGKILDLFLNRFGEYLSTDSVKDSITLIDRLKSVFSLQLKTASLNIGSLPNTEILKTIKDISGFCFILEDSNAYRRFVKVFNEMIKHGEINPVEVEYHRLPPEYKKGKFNRDFNSLDPELSQRLKAKIYDVKNPTYQLWKDVDSRSGYSGLHIILKNADGTHSEIQIMTRAMADLKKVENPFYKMRNGKPLDPKYKKLEAVLAPIKPVNPEKLTDEEKALQKALTKYTQEAYTERLNNPYKAGQPFLKVSEAKTLTIKEKEMLEEFDFNGIKFFIEACEKSASV